MSTSKPAKDFLESNTVGENGVAVLDSLTITSPEPGLNVSKWGRFKNICAKLWAVAKQYPWWTALFLLICVGISIWPCPYCGPTLFLATCVCVVNSKR